MLAETTARRQWSLPSILTVIVLFGSNLLFVNYARASVIQVEDVQVAGGRQTPQLYETSPGGEVIEIDNGKVVDVDNLDPKDPRRKNLQKSCK